MLQTERLSCKNLHQFPENAVISGFPLEVSEKGVDRDCFFLFNGVVGCDVSHEQNNWKSFASSKFNLMDSFNVFNVSVKMLISRSFGSSEIKVW
jgi:hypothetical protein